MPDWCDLIQRYVCEQLDHNEYALLDVRNIKSSSNIHG